MAKCIYCICIVVKEKCDVFLIIRFTSKGERRLTIQGTNKAPKGIKINMSNKIL